MAKQTSFLTYSGKLGDTIGVKTKRGHYVKSRYKRVRQTVATRHAARRFGRASSTAAFIRKALCAVADIRKDEGYINRLTKQLIPAAGMDLRALVGYRFDKAKGINADYKEGVLHVPPQKGDVRIIYLRVDVMARKALQHAILMPGTGTDVPIHPPDTGTWIIAVQIGNVTEIIDLQELEPLAIFHRPKAVAYIPFVHLSGAFIQRE